MKKEENKTTKSKTTKKQTKPATKKSVGKKEKVLETKKEVKVQSKKPTLEEMFGLSYRSIMIIVVSTLIFILLAVSIASLVKGKQNSEPTTDDISIQYSEILLGTLFEQNENAYYVFVYSKDDKYIQTYNTYLSTYKTKSGALKVYTAGLDNGFNKKYMSEEKNLYVSNIDDLKLIGTTLLKVENKRVVAAYDGKDSIISYLKQLVK